MSNPVGENSGVMNSKTRVVLEPELEVQVIHLNSFDRRQLAKVYFRWAIQLFVSSRILEQDELQRKILRLPGK